MHMGLSAKHLLFNMDVLHLAKQYSTLHLINLACNIERQDFCQSVGPEHTPRGHAT